MFQMKSQKSAIVYTLGKLKLHLENIIENITLKMLQK